MAGPCPRILLCFRSGFGWRDRADVDVKFVNEMLVGPVLARMGSGATAGLDPEETSRRITDLVFNGIRAR